MSKIDIDQIRPRHKRTVWLHIYPDGVACSSLEYKGVDGPPDRIACIKVDLDFAEGDGL